MIRKPLLKEQVEVKYLLKTIFQQIDKPSPDTRDAETRIVDKVKGLVERLT